MKINMKIYKIAQGNIDRNEEEMSPITEESLKSDPNPYPFKPFTIHSLRSILLGLKRKALVSGQYEAPYTNEGYDQRDKSLAFRSMGYNANVRQISALEEVIRYIENLKEK